MEKIAETSIQNWADYEEEREKQDDWVCPTSEKLKVEKAPIPSSGELYGTKGPKGDWVPWFQARCITCKGNKDIGLREDPEALTNPERRGYFTFQCGSCHKSLSGGDRRKPFLKSESLPKINSPPPNKRPPRHYSGRQVFN